MNKTIIATLFTLLMGLGCTPASSKLESPLKKIEYPSLSAVIDSRSIEITQLGIYEINRQSTDAGFGYITYNLEVRMPTGVCSFNNSFDFDAKLNGEKWSVYAAPELMSKINKSEALKALTVNLDTMITNCKKVYENARSWEQ